MPKRGTDKMTTKLDQLLGILSENVFIDKTGREVGVGDAVRIETDLFSGKVVVEQITDVDVTFLRARTGESFICEKKGLFDRVIKLTETTA